MSQFQYVSGGMFVNFTHYVDHIVSSYIVSNYPDVISGSNPLTLQQSYVVDSSAVVAPSISFDFESAVPRKIEVGSNYQKYSISYLVDIVGRTQAERDFLAACVHYGCREGNEGISGYGAVSYEGGGTVVKYTIPRAPRDLKGATLRLRFTVDDFSEQ